jgi:ubiquinone biosynthesis monooxygenase Coq7
MGNYDVSVIRPQVKEEEIKFRGEGFSKERLKKIHDALITFHNLETMATNIYRYQVTKEKSELNRLLIAAMLNESCHIQDFEVKLYEYGFRPSILRYAYAILGFGFGFGSRILGKKAMLKLGVWVETKAVAHYAELLEHVEWDEETRQMIEKDQADEDLHISRWSALLKEHS